MSTRTHNRRWHDARRVQGAIVTVREQTSRELRSIDASGVSVNEALAYVVAILDRLDGAWLIVSISTPKSILRDLAGQRGAQPQHRTEARRQVDADPRSFELAMLGRLGRLDLLEPLPARSSSFLKGWRARARRGRRQ